MPDETQGKTVVKIGKHKLIYGWYRMDEGFSHLQFGTLLYKGVRVWEYDVFVGILSVYLRWELPL